MSILVNGTENVVRESAAFVFNTVDYVVFVVMLSISAAIGVYFGFFSKGADTTEEYLMGGKRMKTLPIAISLVASQLSAISIMTIPAEMYAYGINWIFNVICMIVVVPLLNYVIIPVFYNNNISNCYEYLELRFDRNTRQWQTLIFVVFLFLMLPIFIFLPSLAFSQVTGFNVHIINSIVCSICVFYTMFGGIKAVVWTDVVQAAVMVGSVVLVGILGTNNVGGFAEVVRIAGAGERLTVNFAFDLTTRSTFWNIFGSATVMWTSYVGLNQSCVQRIVSLPSLGHARRSLVVFGIGFVVIMFFNCYTGIVMYVRYHGCDPMLQGVVEKVDKMVPYFVQDVVGHLKGMPGVFISCVFSAALSTMSASLNSLAGIIYFDYIKPHIHHTEHKANIVMKLFIFSVGVFCILGGIFVSKFSSLLQIIYCIGGIIFGSIGGVFLLGMLIPRAHSRAALAGVFVSIACISIIVIGSWGRIHYPTLPTSTQSCPAPNTTTTTKPTMLREPQDNEWSIFNLSFNWYAFVGFIITWIVAIPLSYIIPPSSSFKLDPKLLSPVIRPFVKYEQTQVDETYDLKCDKLKA
ncbi:sodium-coupled monocarboxylate transporter 2 [Scaptodrosophila lebanonensis]|uniref:Sodium-coupled monocarboxylate transporter 2 n=1 Tax=Drosophila lebanonensis TaxID=7225 RepID=A0A6J2T4Z5_DROLE|nr:sodium-coupled monocarboxylate transporter 2 [Scaptodrosophila lebanonensis]